MEQGQRVHERGMKIRRPIWQLTRTHS